MEAVPFELGLEGCIGVQRAESDVKNSKAGGQKVRAEQL